jgi:hypothetical protein
MPLPPFNVYNWYWIIVGPTIPLHVYSSAVGDYVSINDSNYVAWKATGAAAIKIESEASLGTVLFPYRLVPASTTSAAGVLAGYNAAWVATAAADQTAATLNYYSSRLRVIETQLSITPPPPPAGSLP